MSFITENEEVIGEVSDWAVEAIQEVIKALMPDGKPFFKEARTEEDDWKEYLSIRGNEEAWAKWVAEQAGAIIMELQDSGVEPDLIASVHPIDIAVSYAVAWSADMESKIQSGIGELSGTRMDEG